MKWSEYVSRLVGDDKQATVADRAGTSGPTVSRWLSGKQLPDAASAVRLARAYKDSPLRALIAAEFITPLEARQRPHAEIEYEAMTNDELADLVARRLRGQEVSESGDSLRSVAKRGVVEEPGEFE